jgi:hypothetical protein
MVLYTWFMICLATGLAGLALAMTIVFEVLLQDWDLVAAARARIRSYLISRRHVSYLRAEDILLEIEKGEGRPSRAVGVFDQRREQLKELHDVEVRLSAPQPQLI